MVFNAKTQRGTAATKETAEARYLRKKFDFSTDPDHVTINLTSVSFLGGEANSDNQVQGFDYGCGVPVPTTSRTTSMATTSLTWQISRT